MKESMIPVPVAGPKAKYLEKNRTFQGIPGIAVTPKGRVFALWYAGGDGEGRENYVTLSLSDDQGGTWTDSVAVVDPPFDHVRAFDSTPWIAPDGRLWLFWAQGASTDENAIFDGSVGVWFSVLENPDAAPADFVWTPPVRICDGIMMNKPTVLSDGSWALPVSVWNGWGGSFPKRGNRGAKMIVSLDNGKSFFERGKTVIQKRWACFDEHSIVEKNDGSLWMVIRAMSGNLDSFSTDGGATWSVPKRSPITGPNSRLWIRRLKSGNLVLVNNDCPAHKPGEPTWGKREKMTAWLSRDDAQSWFGGLLLDARGDVSYPDGQQSADGSLWIIHDHARYAGGEMVVSHITERDIESGKLVSPGSRLLLIASRTKGVPKKAE